MTTWNDPAKTWSDPTATWGEAAAEAGPAFQVDAFQVGAFQTSNAAIGTIAQTTEAPTQAIAGYAGKHGSVAQTTPVSTQAAAGDLSVEGIVAQVAPVTTQAAAGDLGVEGYIGLRVIAFQTDAVQLNAFQAAGDAGVETPAVTQQVFGGVFTAPAQVGEIVQTAPVSTQAATGDLSVEGSIAQTTPVTTQAAEGVFPTTGFIAQTTPLVEQNLLVFVLVTVRPFILTFDPPSAPPNRLVEIVGANFLGATSVTLNGMQTTFTVLSPTSITFTVPKLLDGYYEVLITSAAGTSEGGHQFQVARIHQGRRDDRKDHHTRRILVGPSAPALVENTEGT